MLVQRVLILLELYEGDIL